ncbi:MAG: hypothetical protein EPN85_06640 [Bacteroidetes bacterium]|nr:MAG: hypothetical protein EPN85_06640 [Bacteroidota bacterium]
MKSTANNSSLDAFLKERLKSSDENFQPFDWSEVEVLLKHEKSSVPVRISKQNILIAAAAAGVLILAFSIFRLVQYYSTLPAATEVLTDSTQNSFSIIDTNKTASPDSAVHKADFSAIDSSAIAIKKKKTDSIATPEVAPKVTQDSFGESSVKKVNDKEIPSVVKTTPKQDKKKKQDTIQKAVAPDTASAKVIADTTSKPAPKEVVIETPSVPDTADKKLAAEGTGSKKKKSKAKKGGLPSPPADQKTDTPVAKPDSLKR